MPPGAFTARACLLAFFSWLTVLTGVVLLAAVPAVRETVEALSLKRTVFTFAVAEFYWGLCAWYCARLVLEKRFAPFDPLLPCSHPRYARGLVSWLPRVVGLLAMVPLAVSIGVRSATVPALQRWWWVPSVVAVAFLAFVVFRRRVFGDVVDYEEVPEPGYLYRRFTRINWRGWCLLGALGVVPIVVFLGLGIAPRGGSRWLGTPALALFALGSWNLSAGFGLIYLPLSRGRSAWTVYPFAAAFLFSIWMENHNVPIGPPPDRSAAVVDTRPALADAWSTWLKAHDAGVCRAEPIYLVAAAGGASRAAFWTADLLTTLEEAGTGPAADGPGCFARSVFAVSGVSGGSLGAATFVSLLADEEATGRRIPDLPARASAFLTRDMLSPVAGYFLYEDLVQRIVPFPITAWDRSHGLEDTWTSDWRELESGWRPGATTADRFGQPLTALYGDDQDHALPALVLNTTRVSDGRRVLQSNLQFAPDDMYDLLSGGFLTAGLTLAGAVHNSARFMYVSPAGRAWAIGAHQAPTPWGYLVDGGYFENSGAGTLIPVVHAIPAADRARLRVILISNDPDVGQDDYICAEPGAPTVPAPVPSSFAMELTAPLGALLASRTSRAHAADVTLARVLGDGNLSHVFELRMPHVAGKEPPMTWFVSPAIAADMDEFIRDPPTDAGGRFRANLLALEAAVSQGTDQPSPCGGLNER